MSVRIYPADELLPSAPTFKNASAWTYQCIRADQLPPAPLSPSLARPLLHVRANGLRPRGPEHVRSNVAQTR
jgi:hypothetical protein